MFNIILWALTHYKARPMEVRTDKRGVPFVSAQFEWPPKQWATDYFDPEKPFTIWVKSLVVYATKKGRYLLLANIGGINKDGKMWSGTTRFVIRPNKHSWTVFEKGKYKGTLFNVHLAWQEMLPLENAPASPSFSCDCKTCSPYNNAVKEYREAGSTAHAGNCNCEACLALPF